MRKYELSSALLRLPVVAAAATSSSAAPAAGPACPLARSGPWFALWRFVHHAGTERFDKSLPVLDHRGRLAVDFEPRQRVFERPALHQRALGPW